MDSTEMEAERGQRIEALCRAAREREPEDRSAFLAEACQGDEELRREVESRLAQCASEAASREAPASETAPCLAAPPGRRMLACGDQLGPYQILGLLGAGGLGEVYDALDPRLNRHVALKVLTRRAVAEGFEDRFVREARAAASVNHPNIAHVYEIAEAGGTCYIAMEYIEGATLRQRIGARESTLRELLEYLRQTASALTKAHTRGVVHCDLKPDNIMVTRDGYAKVLDFGLAKLIERYKRAEISADELPSPVPGRAMLPESKTAVIVGTPGYMSPEQAEGRGDIDERSDVFSFGCILFEAATRKPPFEDASVTRTLHNLLYEPAPRIGSYCPDAPPALQFIIDACLEKDPATRCSSMEEVSRSLGDLLREMQTAQPVVPAPKPSEEPLAPSGRPQPTSIGLRRRVAAAVVAAIAIAAGTIAYLRWHPVPAVPSVAVIPFVNARNTPESEYLSDGLSESLINALAQLPDLKVIARSSSFKFKAQGIEVRRAARMLRAQMLVTGRVAELGGRLRITAELVNGADGTQVWGAQYSAGISSLPGVAAEISREIAGRLRSKLTQAEQAKLAKGRKVKPEAYELFLRGRYQVQLYTPESRQKAIEYYQQALAIDPGFALANAELAYCYRLLSGSAILSPAEMMPKAEAAARRALAADADLAEAHGALADIKKDQWDWAAAERAYRRALELNPNLAVAHQGYAVYLSVTGRHEEAIAEMQRVSELDPIGLPAAIHAAAVYYNARRYDQALEALKRAADLDPSAPIPWTWTGIVKGGSGRFSEAIPAYEKALGFGDDTAATQCYYAYSLARAGRRERALQILKGLQRSDGFVPSLALAILYTGLDQKERAIQLLETAYASRDPLLQYVKVESHFDSLSGDQRFQNLAARIGLK